jgi:hypothetical protein
MRGRRGIIITGKHQRGTELFVYPREGTSGSVRSRNSHNALSKAKATPHTLPASERRTTEGTMVKVS